MIEFFVQNEKHREWKINHGFIFRRYHLEIILIKIRFECFYLSNLLAKNRGKIMEISWNYCQSAKKWEPWIFILHIWNKIINTYFHTYSLHKINVSYVCLFPFTVYTHSPLNWKKIGDQILIITYSLVLVISSDMFAFQVIICGYGKEVQEAF